MRQACALIIMVACLIGAASQDRINGFVLMLAVTYLAAGALLLVDIREKDR